MGVQSDAVEPEDCISHSDQRLVSHRVLSGGFEGDHATEIPLRL